MALAPGSAFPISATCFHHDNCSIYWRRGLNMYDYVHVQELNRLEIIQIHNQAQESKKSLINKKPVEPQ